MNRLLPLCLAAALSAPEPSAPAQSSSSEPAEEPSSAPAPREEDYPLPELSDTEQKLLLDQLKGFASAFGDQVSVAGPDELDEGTALAFCMAQADRQKDLYGYYFDTDADGALRIPAPVVADMAERFLDLPDFAPTGSDLYDPEFDCYRYAPARETARYALSSPKGAPEEGVRYEVDYLGEDGDPLYTLRFTFGIGRLNGMPYLRFVAKQAL